MTQKAWYIGNTTIRNAKRLKDGLRVLANSHLHGNLIGRENELEFAKLLSEAGVVSAIRDYDSHSSTAGDMGRKWRAALMQLGFIRSPQEENPFTITPNGKRLIEATNLPSEQECFLRSLLAYQIPSQIENFPSQVFSPLRIILEVLNALEKRGMDASISKEEMASIVQLVVEIENVEKAVLELSDIRRTISTLGNRRDKIRFLREYRENVARDCDRQKSDTLFDYADTNFRYLKLTGLFVETGRKLSFAPYKKTIIEQILSKSWEPIPDNQYLSVLTNGASLPTDNAPQAIEAIKSTISLLEDSGKEVSIPEFSGLDVADLSQLRFVLEEDWLKQLEKQYALGQKEQWEEILAYLRALTEPKRGIIPQGEAPAYFEWAIWRAFLAINSLVNEPWEARRFRVDQEFLPMSPAPGNGPDLIFEFEDFVLVGEVTLTSSSRQEAAEGEPVRRHVAELIDKYEEMGKRVYGLFVANRIDTNTAETFRIGVWYRPDDSKMALRIVPLTLTQFADLFEAGFKEGRRLDSHFIEDLLRDCIIDSNNDAPNWKRLIGTKVNLSLAKLQRQN